MDSRLVALLQRLNGCRLWLLFSLTTVVAALLIVSLMDLALMGRITADYLITGLVTAPPVVACVPLSSLSTPSSWVLVGVLLAGNAAGGAGR